MIVKTMRKLILSIAMLTAVGPLPAAEHPFPPFGALVDIGGRRLHIHCSGEGSPAVIVENGGGSFSFDWALVQPELAKSTRVCTYDRAGYAWSDPGPKPITFEQTAGDLHNLLQNANIKPPYILVGQSAGGQLIREYHRQHPAEIAGMVLAESIHENAYYILNGRMFRYPEISREDLEGLVKPPQGNAPKPPVIAQVSAPFDKLPAKLHPIRVWAFNKYMALQDSNQLEPYRQQFARIYRMRSERPFPLGDLPLIVLTRADSEPRAIPSLLTLEQAEAMNEDRKRLQDDLAALSSNSMHITSGHVGQDMEVDDPKLIVLSVLKVLQAVRAKTPLRN